MGKFVGENISETIEISQNSNASRKELKSTIRNLESKLARVESEMVSSYDDLFDNAVESARGILQADRCTLWIVDGSTKELWSKIAQGMDPIRVPSDKGIVGACFRSKTYISVPDAYDDNRFNPSVDKKTGYKTKSILCAPILNAGDKTVIGVLQAINKVAEHTDVFSKDDITAAQQYCSHLARAVENCQRKQSGKEELLQSSMEIKKFTVNVAASLAEMKIEETKKIKK